MALFKTIDDLTPHVPVLESANVNALLPSLKAAELKYLRDGVLGKTLYDALHAAYTADSTLPSNTAWRPLLEMCQQTIGLLGLHTALPLVNVLFSSGGLQVNSSPATGQVAASEYRSRAAQGALYKQGLDALDQLIVWLWENTADVPTWTSSNFYRLHGRGVVRTVQDVEQGGVRLGSGGWMMYVLLPAFRRAEERVSNLLCTTQYTELVDRLIANTLTTAEIAFLDKVKEYVAHAAIAEQHEPMGLTIDNDGAWVFENSNAAGGGAGGPKPAPDSRMNAHKNKYELLAESLFKNVETKARAAVVAGHLTTYAASTCYTSGATEAHMGDPNSGSFSML